MNRSLRIDLRLQITLARHATLETASIVEVATRASSTNLIIFRIWDSTLCGFRLSLPTLTGLALTAKLTTGAFVVYDILL
jgi:hypothetical protein